MNPDTAIFILSDKVRAIRTRYEPFDSTDRRTPNDNMAKTFDPDIAPGDLVIVETNTRWGFTVVKVVDVDVDIDLDKDKPKWIVGVLDPAQHLERKQKEGFAYKRIIEAEKLAQRKDLRAKLEAAVGTDTLKALSFNGASASASAPASAPAEDPDEDMPF